MPVAMDWQPEDPATKSWFLGATGDLAHQPALPTIAAGSLRPSADIDPHDQSRCAVFLTQIPARPHVPRCQECQVSSDLHPAADQ